MLENVAPLPGEDEISLQAKLALEELTRGVNLLAQVTSYYSGIPLIQMWRTDTEEVLFLFKSTTNNNNNYHNNNYLFIFKSFVSSYSSWCQ
uniref:Uncharacterized protein n=1 Tax=Denticeps clupeoides TaxID=299321 RepID=A0AAY4CNB7_9TELE